jgi:GntR family transcriptional regulator, carbon starvation induced regulator
MIKKYPQNQTLVEQAFYKLRDDIVFSIFKPTDKLNIESLKKRYQMGGTPIREALNRLVEWGLVEALPLKGFRVHAVSIEKAQDIMQNRLWIEGRLIERVLNTTDDVWESQCVAAMHRLKRCLQQEDSDHIENLKKWVQLSQQLIQTLYSECGSEWLWRSYQGLYLHAMSYEYQALISIEEPKPYIEAMFKAYEVLVDQCVDRQLSRVLKLQENYLTQLTDFIERYFKQRGEQDE